MTTSSKRPEQVAWTSLVASLVFFGVAFFLGQWSGFIAVSAVSWHILAAVLIWLVLAIQFHQRNLAEQERLDMTQLAREKHSSTIFQEQGERASLMAVAQRRLELIEKWFVPGFAVVIAVYEIAMGWYILRGMTAAGRGETQQPLVAAIVMMAVAFVTFLLSRYATGMSAEPRWKPLRAGGSYLLGVAVVCFALAIGLALIHFQQHLPVRIIGYVIPILLMVLGVETTLNVILDIYRPRLKGQYSRAAFDSRLLGIINEPGGIFRSAAAAMDYQFGFEVSQTWFYKLLEKAIVPLVLFSAVTLYLASCIVVIGPDEEAVIERFGNPRAGNGEVRIAKPGIHFKLPWPIETVHSYATGKINELHIGYVPNIDPRTGVVIPEPSLLWGEAHYQEEQSFLVASEYTDHESDDGAPPVGLTKANLPVRYRIKDVYAYLYNHSDPVKLLEGICYEELTRFTASSKVEVDDVATVVDPAGASLFGAGRARARDVLFERIQQAADEAELGVEIVFVGLQGIHPPAEIAPDYQAVIGAIQRQQTLVLEAEAERNRRLSTLTGTVSRAYALAELAAAYQEAQSQDDAEQVENLGRQLDEAFAEASGDIYRILAEAQSYAYAKAADAKATGERFAGQLRAYQAAPNIYPRQQRLSVLEEALTGIRKYIVVSHPHDNQVTIVNLEERPATDLLGWMDRAQESSAQ